MREDCAHGSFSNGLLPVEKTLVLVTVTSLLLVGCGGKSNPPAQTTNAVPTADRIKATPPTALGRYVAAPEIPTTNGRGSILSSNRV